MVLLSAALSAGELDVKRAVLKASSTVVRKEFAKVDVLVDPLADVKVLQVAEEMDSYLVGLANGCSGGQLEVEKTGWKMD